MQRIIVLILIILLIPLYLLIMLILLIVNQDGIFFLQPRSGKGEKVFVLYKFRTLKIDNDESLHPEISPFCLFLRKAGLDELPQLWNVLTGDMNLVGPRPLLPIYGSRYSESQRRRFIVKPGVFGLSQLRSLTTILDWEAKLDLDVWYVDNKNAYMDLKIILQSVWVLCSFKRISHQDFTPFEGNG